jgi:hypothetical protein
MAWPIEDIPDDDELFMRVHRKIIEGDHIPHGVFRDPDGRGMSTDWSKYASPHETRGRAAQPASEYAVIALRVGDVRAKTPLRVQHSPIAPNAEQPPGNRAHADILGLAALSKGDKVQARVNLWRVSRMRIAINDPVIE